MLNNASEVRAMHRSLMDQIHTALKQNLTYKRPPEMCRSFDSDERYTISVTLKRNELRIPLGLHEVLHGNDTREHETRDDGHVWIPTLELISLTARDSGPGALHVRALASLVMSQLPQLANYYQQYFVLNTRRRPMDPVMRAHLHRNTDLYRMARFDEDGYFHVYSQPERVFDREGARELRLEAEGGVQ